MTVEELEGKRRRDIEEALIKRDLKRHKLLEAHDMPGALAQQGGADDAGAVTMRRRGKLMLPAPQVGDRPARPPACLPPPSLGGCGATWQPAV